MIFYDFYNCLKFISYMLWYVNISFNKYLYIYRNLVNIMEVGVL